MRGFSRSPSQAGAGPVNPEPGPRPLTGGSLFTRRFACPRLLLAAPLSVRGQELSDSALRSILQDRVATKRAVGLAVGVLDHGQRKIFTAGTADAPGVALDENTVSEE